MSRHHARLDRRRWRIVRLEVLERDGWRCQHCGRYGNEVDHVTPLQWEPDQDPYALAGLQTLCRACHIAKTRDENINPDRLTWNDYIDEIMSRETRNIVVSS